MANDLIKLGKSRGQLIQVDTKTAAQWDIEGYQKAVEKSGRTGIQRSLRIIAKDAPRFAPRDQKRHRVIRKYLSGYESSWSDPDRWPLTHPKSYKVITRRTLGTGNAFWGKVKALQGYSVFVHYGTEHQKARPWLNDVLDYNKSKIIPNLRAEWPK